MEGAGGAPYIYIYTYIFISCPYLNDAMSLNGYIYIYIHTDIHVYIYIYLFICMQTLPEKVKLENLMLLSPSGPPHLVLIDLGVAESWLGFGHFRV